MCDPLQVILEHLTACLNSIVQAPRYRPIVPHGREFFAMFSLPFTFHLVDPDMAVSRALL